MVAHFTNSSDPFQVLPLELSLHVLSYLKPKDLETCTKVSTKWKEISSDIVFWKSLVRRDNLKFIDPDVETMRGCLLGMEKKRLRSDDEIVSAIRNFVKKLYPFSAARFSCVLLGDKNRIINIETRPVLPYAVRLGPDIIEIPNLLGFVPKNKYAFVDEYIATKPINMKIRYVEPPRDLLSGTSIDPRPTSNIQIPHEENKVTVFKNQRYLTALILSFPKISNTFEYELHQSIVQAIKQELDYKDLKFTSTLLAVSALAGIVLPGEGALITALMLGGIILPIPPKI